MQQWAMREVKEALEVQLTLHFGYPGVNFPSCEKYEKGENLILKNENKSQVEKCRHWIALNSFENDQKFFSTSFVKKLK